MPGRRRRVHFQQLSDFERGRLVGLREAGWSYRRIAEQIGREVSVVVRWWRRWSEQHCHTRRRGTGAHRRTDERTDRRVRRTALSSRTSTASQIRASVAPEVTVRTIRNRLLEAGLRARVPLACVPLTPAHRRERLQWCRQRLHWRTEWQTVVFSDESRFCLGASDGRIRVRRRTGERLHPSCIRQRHTAPTPGLLVWGAISYHSRTQLVFVSGTLNSTWYIHNIIQPVVVPFVTSVNNGVFQHDNARPHTTRATQHALRGVRQLPWPARSPDLSPIEHIWDMMGQRLLRSPRPATTIPDLRIQIEDAWNSIPQSHIQHLYDRLHDRIAECVTVNGGSTSY